LRSHLPRRERFRIASCITAIRIVPPVSRVAGLGEPVSIAGIALLYSCRNARWMPTRPTRFDDRRIKPSDVPWLEQVAYTSVHGLHFGVMKDILVRQVVYLSSLLVIGCVCHPCVRQSPCTEAIVASLRMTPSKSGACRLEQRGGSMTLCTPVGQGTTIPSRLPHPLTAEPSPLSGEPKGDVSSCRGVQSAAQHGLVWQGFQT
jgi:hypothetical protein